MSLCDSAIKVQILTDSIEKRKKKFLKMKGRRKMTILTVFNDKGGTAKTTTVLNLGVGLALQGKSVLLIDGDKQQWLSQWLQHKEDGKPSTVNLVFDAYTGITTDPSTYIRHHEKLGLDYIPANEKLTGVGDILKQCPDPLNVLTTALADPYFQQYDYIIIDNQPTYDLWVGNVFKAANKIFIPMECDNYSFQGIESTLKKLQKIKRREDVERYIAGVILTKFRGITKESKAYRQKVQEQYPGFLLSPPIPFLAEATKCLESRQAAVAKKGSAVGQAYKDLIESYFHLN